jgi:hypothetical protein
MQAQGRMRERLIALFMLGALLLTPPLLIVFNHGTRVFGVPALYLYLFAVWAALIALVALAVGRWDAADGLEEAEREAAGTEPAPITGASDDA